MKISQLEKSVADLEKKEQYRGKLDSKKGGVDDEKLEDFLNQFDKSKY